MKDKEVISRLVDIHNLLISISVKGEDAIAMGMVLQEIRNFIMQLQEKEASG